MTPREYAEIAAVARDLERFGMRRNATRLRGLLGAPPNDEPPCPIQDEARQVRAIPWGLAHILYPAYGHDQTLEQLARRGGFGRVELGMLAADCYGSLDQAGANVFAADYGTRWPKAPPRSPTTSTCCWPSTTSRRHWIDLRTTNPIKSTFATVRLRPRVTKGPGSRAAGVATAFKLIESAQSRWRAVSAPHLVALLRVGAESRTASSSSDRRIRAW